MKQVWIIEHSRAGSNWTPVMETRTWSNAREGLFDRLNQLSRHPDPAIRAAASSEELRLLSLPMTSPRELLRVKVGEYAWRMVRGLA